MARINDGVLKNWLDGNVVKAVEYKQEREVLRMAINDNHERLVQNAEQIDSKVNKEDVYTKEELDHTLTPPAVDLELKKLNASLTDNVQSIGKSSVNFPKIGAESDDTDRLQRLLDSVENGVTVTITPGTYRVKTLIMKKKKNVKVIGYGVEIKRTQQDLDLFELTACEDVVVEGLIVNGNSEILGGKEGQYHNISCYGSKRISFVNVNSVYSVSDGFYITRIVSERRGVTVQNPTDSENITFINCHANFSYRQGMSVITVDGLLAMNCSFSNTGKGVAGGGTPPNAGVDLESNVGTPWEPKNCHFINCKFLNNIGSGFLTTSSTNRVILENCLIKDNGSYGLSAQSTDVILRNVEIINNGHRNTSLRASLNVTNPGSQNKIGSILLENVTIKEGHWGGLMYEEGVKIITRGLIIEDTNNFAIRQVNTGLSNKWAITQLEDVQVSRIYDGKNDGFSGVPSYILGVSTTNQPTFIKRMIVDNTNLDVNKVPVRRGVDLFTFNDLRELLDLDIRGDFSEWVVRHVREKAQSVRNNKLNGEVISSLNYTRGATSNRPHKPALNRQYFDTSLNKPIFWDGEAWRDFTGLAV